AVADFDFDLPDGAGDVSLNIGHSGTPPVLVVTSGSIVTLRDGSPTGSQGAAEVDGGVTSARCTKMRDRIVAEVDGGPVARLHR
ncbi:MAG TPA: hypothetical protein VG295_05870, partial [Solirubrobacteraceae bacterium]|nr:hypothetical protein [Solirubrobacteraceae bacterium]